LKEKSARATAIAIILRYRLLRLLKSLAEAVSPRLVSTG
jgi:hypothetical protein